MAGEYAAVTYGVISPLPVIAPAVVVQPVLTNPAPWRGKFYGNFRGAYRIFNTALYYFHYSSTGTPNINAPALESNATLPYTTTSTYTDGEHRFSVDKSNGILHSGFMPLGEQGQTFKRIDVSSNVEVSIPPAGVTDWHLVQNAGGVITIEATYFEASSTLRGDTWAITYTVNGDTPAEDSPTDTESISTTGMAVLVYNIPAQAHGTTVKVRLQTLRDTTYSEGSTVKTITADATGPTAPPAGSQWTGGIPE